MISKNAHTCAPTAHAHTASKRLLPKNPHSGQRISGSVAGDAPRRRGERREGAENEAGEEDEGDERPDCALGAAASSPSSASSSAVPSVLSASLRCVPQVDIRNP